jgi:hypothetical protein
MDGGSFSGLLTLIFITLKLTGFINWSWWWVLSPLWISFGLLLVLLIVVFIAVVVFGKKDYVKSKIRKFRRT